MVFSRDTFYIEEQKLSQALELNLKEFDNFVDVLISGDRTLHESIHFIVQYRNAGQPIRLFSREGAIAITRSLEKEGIVNDAIIESVLSLVEQYRIEQIDTKVCRSIYEHSSSLLVKNQRHWLSYQDVVKIFRTTVSRLTSARESITRSDNPMILGEDFDIIEQYVHFSLSGLEKLSIELSLSLRSQERREYCERVREVAPPVLEFLALAPSPLDSQIKRAKTFVKNQNNKSCQITGATRNKYDNSRLKLVAHHLYDQNNYRFLADDPDNIIAIREEISDEFHLWNGGFDKSCTIDDFIEYIEWKYPEKHDKILMLYNRRKVLALKLIMGQRTLPYGE